MSLTSSSSKSRIAGGSGVLLLLALGVIEFLAGPTAGAPEEAIDEPGTARVPAATADTTPVPAGPQPREPADPPATPAHTDQGRRP